MLLVEWHKKTLCSLNCFDFQIYTRMRCCTLALGLKVEASRACMLDRIGGPYNGPTDDDTLTSIGRRLAERRREEGGIAKGRKGHSNRAIAQLRIASVAAPAGAVFECREL